MVVLLLCPQNQFDGEENNRIRTTQTTCENGHLLYFMYVHKPPFVGQILGHDCLKKLSYFGIVDGKGGRGRLKT